MTAATAEPATSVSADKPVGHGTAAGWGVGTMATTTMLNGASVVLLFFLVTFLKIEPLLAGALLFGSKMLDVVTDPPMGIIRLETT